MPHAKKERQSRPELLKRVTIADPQVTFTAVTHPGPLCADALDAITEHTLRELRAVGAVQGFRIVGLKEGGLGVIATCGSGDTRSHRVLCTSRGGLRKFASLDSAAAFLRDMQVEQFLVDVSEHKPGRVRRARPDRSEALKRTRTTPTQGSLLLNEVGQ